MIVFFIQLIVLVIQINHSLQGCTSTIGLTICEDIQFSSQQPLKIRSYKHLLRITGKHIDVVQAGSFQLLPEITTLHLSFNTISQLEPKAFLGLVNLKQIYLHSNRLEQIADETFVDCDNLILLDLGGNKIKTIEQNAFKELKNLEELNLSFNELENIPLTLGVLSKLRKLDLSNNKIATVTPNSFSGLSSLEHLSLETNKIQQIKHDGFKGLVNVGDISLADNYLSSLNTENVVSNLRSLRTIKLSINNFVCNKLRTIIDEFRSAHVIVKSGFSKSNVTVNGITCKLQ